MRLLSRVRLHGPHPRSRDRADEAVANVMKQDLVLMYASGMPLPQIG